MCQRKVRQPFYVDYFHVHRELVGSMIWKGCHTRNHVTRSRREQSPETGSNGRLSCDSVIVAESDL